MQFDGLNVENGFVCPKPSLVSFRGLCPTSPTHYMQITIKCIHFVCIQMYAMVMESSRLNILTSNK